MMTNGRAAGVAVLVAWVGLGLGTVGPATGAERAPDVARAIEQAPEATRDAVARALDAAGGNAANLAGAILEAPDADRRAAVAFLVAHMPPGDRATLGKGYLLANVDYAFKARNATEWAKAVPLELFYNDVLPYSSVNEHRDDWRRDFYDRFIAVAKAAPNAAEAAKRLNVAAFEAFGVKYHATKRPKPDQSPYESAKAGYASCTGLSIILIDACRAVGIPARIVGTPEWTTQRGNHNWVEVWDREWSFVGACEPSKLNEGWFVEQASKADEANPRHRIYAASFGAGAEHFPLVWQPGNADYPAEDVTRRYTKRRKVTFKLPGDATSADAPAREITVRHDGRIVAHGPINPDATFELPGDSSYEVQLVVACKPAASTRTVKLSLDPDQVIPLPLP